MCWGAPPGLNHGPCPRPPALRRRFAAPHLKRSLEAVSLSSPSSVAFFLRDVDGFLASFSEHAKHEEEILFPAVRAVFPGISDGGHREHEELEKFIPDIRAAVSSLRSGADADAALATLRAKLPPLLIPHLRSEELVMPVISACLSRRAQAP